MRKHIKKIVGTLISLSIILLINTNVFAVNMSAVINEGGNLVYITETVYNVPHVFNFAPGDEMNHLSTLRNDTARNVNIHFIETTSSIPEELLRHFTVRIYINGDVYIDGRADMYLRGPYIYNES